MQITVSDPTKKLHEINVKINAKLTGLECVWMEEEKCSLLKFLLHDGSNSGKSVVREFEVIQSL